MPPKSATVETLIEMDRCTDRADFYGYVSDNPELAAELAWEPASVISRTESMAKCGWRQCSLQLHTSKTKSVHRPGCPRSLPDPDSQRQSTT